LPTVVAPVVGAARRARQVMHMLTLRVIWSPRMWCGITGGCCA
jgi:hypothetical protein